jgi:hypothetical protein
MSKDVFSRASALNQRTTPGRGVEAADDGLTGLHLRSVPNVSSDRLRRSLSFYHGTFHTAEGLHRFDGPRRTLLDNGVRMKAIAHELKLRGDTPGECSLCWDH